MRSVSKRIIIVNDVNDFIQSEETLLSRESFALRTVTSGDEALFWARNDMPDLLILHFYMPDLNGYHVCRELKGDSSTKHIPVLIIATQGEDDDPCNLTKAAGCDGCILKPIHHDDLVPAVEKLLGIPPRRHQRIETSLSCIITDEDGRREATILNITPEGILLKAEPLPWAGDIIKLDLTRNDTDQPMSFRVAVRWTREPDETFAGGSGCEFLDIPSDILEWLKDNVLSLPQAVEE